MPAARQQRNPQMRVLLWVSIPQQRFASKRTVRNSTPKTGRIVGGSVTAVRRPGRPGGIGRHARAVRAIGCHIVIALRVQDRNVRVKACPKPDGSSTQACSHSGSWRVSPPPDLAAATAAWWLILGPIGESCNRFAWVPARRDPLGQATRALVGAGGADVDGRAVSREPGE